MAKLQTTWGSPSSCIWAMPFVGNHGMMEKIFCFLHIYMNNYNMNKRSLMVTEELAYIKTKLIFIMPHSQQSRR